VALARKPFVVLDAEILSSSVWSEAAHVRLVWITLLILCDTEGYVGASVPGIASAAGVSLKEAEEAIAKLRAPDPYSRTQANEGRRLEESERGWRVLNFLAHLDRLSSERKRARDRVWRHRQRAKDKEETPCNDIATTEERQSSQGVGNREQGVGSKTEVGRSVVVEAPDNGPPALPPADRTERAIQATTDGLRTKLYALVDEAVQVDPKKRDPTELMRIFTGYTKADGRAVNGVVNAALLTYERLEKSVADAEATVAEWRHGTA
jgi:hypothetical protein